MFPTYHYAKLRVKTVCMTRLKFVKMITACEQKIY